MKLDNVIIDVRNMSGADALRDLVGLCGAEEVQAELDKIARPDTLVGFPIRLREGMPSGIITLGDWSRYIKWRRIS